MKTSDNHISLVKPIQKKDNLVDRYERDMLMNAIWEQATKSRPLLSRQYFTFMEGIVGTLPSKDSIPDPFKWRGVVIGYQYSSGILQMWQLIIVNGVGTAEKMFPVDLPKNKKRISGWIILAIVDYIVLLIILMYIAIRVAH